MSSLETILILVLLFLNFPTDSHSLQEDSSPSSRLEAQLSLQLDAFLETSFPTPDTENVTKSSEFPTLSSIDEFCSAKVMDSIGLVYHVGSHLLLSITQEPNGSISSNQTNDTVKQWFYVYNWKTGDLYHKLVELDEIFVIPDALKPNGLLVFATSLWVSTKTGIQESQLVMATFSTATASLESYTCHDLTSADPSLTANQFLSTRMFRLANSTTTEGVFVPKLSLYSTVLELMPLRGRIGFGGGILIRDELACSRIGFSGNSTTVQYASGFTLPELLVLQAKPGFVQIGPNGTEIPISKLLNCPLFLEPNSSSSSVFPNELKLVPVATTEIATSVNPNPQDAFSFLQLFETFIQETFIEHPYLTMVCLLGLVVWITPCCMRIGEEIFDDYTEYDYKPKPEKEPQQVQFV